MTDTAYFGYLSAAVALASILVSVYFYVRALRLQKQIAVSQGAFRSSRISIHVFGDVGCDNYMLAVPLSRAEALLLPFRYAISNTGDSSAEDVEVFVRMSKFFHGSGRPRLRQTTGIKKIKCALVSETEGTLTFGFTIPTIHSGEAIAVKDDLLLYAETIRERDVQATTADGVNLTLKTWAEFAFVIDFTIMQKHSMPITRRISITVIDNSNKHAKVRIDEYNAALRQSMQRAVAGQSLLRRVFSWRKGRRILNDFKVLEFAGDLRPYKGRRDLLQLTGSFDKWDGVRFEDQLWAPGLELAYLRSKDSAPTSTEKPKSLEDPRKEIVNEDT